MYVCVCVCVCVCVYMCVYIGVGVCAYMYVRLESIVLHNYCIRFIVISLTFYLLCLLIHLMDIHYADKLHL